MAGINFGENVSVSVTISGTVGAALEGAAAGIPAIAVSLETDQRYHLSHSDEIDFSTAAYFTTFFAEKLLRAGHINDLDVLKIDVPADATPETAWQVTRLSRAKYYIPVSPRRTRLDQPGSVGYEVIPTLEGLEPDSDVYALRVNRKVSVTPLSLDMTSRVSLDELERRLAS